MTDRARRAVRRRPADRDAVRRRASAPNITPDRETGIGAWSDDEFDAAAATGQSPRRQAGCIRPCRSRLHQDVARRRARDPRLSRHGGARPQRGRGEPAAVPVQHPRRHDGLGRALFHAGRIQVRTATSPRHGIAAPISSRARAIAAPATRRRRCSAATRPPRRCRAMPSRAGSRPTSPTTRGAASAAGRVDDIVAYLKTGHNRFAAATGPMAEEVALSSSHMTDADLARDRDLSEGPAGARRCRAAVAAADPAMVAGGGDLSRRLLRLPCGRRHGRGRPVPALCRIVHRCARAIRRR